MRAGREGVTSIEPGEISSFNARALLISSRILWASAPGLADLDILRETGKMIPVALAEEI